MGNYTINTISDGFVLGTQTDYGRWIYHGPDVRVITINSTSQDGDIWLILFGKEVEDGYISTPSYGNFIIKDYRYRFGLVKRVFVISSSLVVSDLTVEEARAILDGSTQTIPVQFVRQGGYCQTVSTLRSDRPNLRPLSEGGGVR